MGKGDIEREKKLKLLGDKYATLRAELKKKIKNPKLSNQERTAAMCQLDALPKNSSRVRQRNRCSITGKARGYRRLFGLSQLTVRRLAKEGLLPGVFKLSW